MQGIIRTIRDGSGFDILLLGLALLYLIIFWRFPSFTTSSCPCRRLTCSRSLHSTAHWLQYYYDIFSQPVAGTIFWNTVKFVVLSIVFQLSIGFGLALFFQQDFPGASYLRGLFLAGWIMPALVVGAIWKWLFAGDFGVINYALTSLGIADDRVSWLSDPNVALYAVIIANIWLGIPFNMILLSVGLASIPRDVDRGRRT